MSGELRRLADDAGFIRKVLNIVAESECLPFSHDIAQQLGSDNDDLGLRICHEMELSGFIYREGDHEPWRLTLKGRIMRWVFNRSMR